jgi:hypothetical protein
MKDHTQRLLVPLALLFAALFAAAAQAEIYKVVDEDGNVTYTDQKPSPDAQPVQLRGLSIISPQQPTTQPPSQRKDEAAAEEEAVTSIRDLRRGYRDFALVSPEPDQTIWGNETPMTVVWNTRYALQPGMLVTVYLNGAPQPPTSSPAVNIGRLNRGSHQVYAELTDARNRPIATTQTVEFHIRQHSALFPGRQDAGGGG